MKKKIDGFVYGTQYYRAPTPLPEEWEDDLKNMKDSPIDTIQVRVQWRWNEPAEGRYLFDDVDRLFDLAEKYGKKVIFKFLMECAPDYIFVKHKGHRKDMNGNPLNPGALGAYYVGGWIPCFDNPAVVDRAKEFVRIFVERYVDRNNLLMWNVWNEPVSRPMGECGCEHSIRAYRKWLERRYGDVDSLNEKFGKRWESFDTVMPPAMPLDYAELFLWRLWAMDAVRARLAFMYETVRKLERKRPVMSHVGCCSVIQDVAASSSDDIQNAQVVDFYGTSLPTAVHFTNIMEEIHPFLICDWLRSVSEYFWVYELYPDWGDWHKTISAEDFRFKVWSTIASGSKGLLYWQYRAERLGNENNLAGLVNIDGSFKQVTAEAFKIGKIIKEHENLFMSSRVQTDGIGILYSLESDLVNRVENTRGRDFWSFDLAGEFPYLYKKALFGVYALFRELGITAEWVECRNLKNRLDSLKALYMPEPFILSDGTISLIKEFISRGGIVIAEEGAGLRRENTWLQSHWPGGGLDDVFGLRIAERVSADRDADGLNLFGRTVPAGGYASYLRPGGSETEGCWEDSRPGACRKGKAFFIGTSLGSSFHDNFEKHYDDYVHIMLSVFRSCGMQLPFDPSNRGLYLRKLVSGDNIILFAFNRSDVVKKMRVEKNMEIVREITGFGRQGAVTKEELFDIPPRDVRIYIFSMK